MDKAREVADLLLPAFKTPTGFLFKMLFKNFKNTLYLIISHRFKLNLGIPLALVNMKTGNAVNFGWASGGCSILSEFGSLELEFDYLSRVTGNSTYVEKARHIRKFLSNLEKPDGLYPLFLNPKSGKFCLSKFLS